MCWYGYNPHFQWKPYEDEDMSSIDKKWLVQARTNPFSAITLPAGKRETQGLSTWTFGKINVNLCIEPRFLANKSYGTEGCCTWLSACILVHLSDPSTSKKMLDLLKKTRLAAQT